MPVYRTQFERVNFDFEPPLYQKADVVFQIDIPNDDEHENELYEAGWSAMWKQNPHWMDRDLLTPVEGYAGWSSVMGGRKITEVIDRDLDFDLGIAGEGLPRIGETFICKIKGRAADEHSYRVTGFYKTWKPIKSTTAAEKMTDGFLAEILAEERAAMTATERAKKDSMMKVVQCERDEAEFISGAGVAGCIRRIEDIEITGIVGWEARTIARYRRDYKVLRDEWPTEIWKYWEHGA